MNDNVAPAGQEQSGGALAESLRDALESAHGRHFANVTDPHAAAQHKAGLQLDVSDHLLALQREQLERQRVNEKGYLHYINQLQGKGDAVGIEEAKSIRDRIPANRPDWLYSLSHEEAVKALDEHIDTQGEALSLLANANRKHRADLPNLTTQQLETFASENAALQAQAEALGMNQQSLRELIDRQAAAYRERVMPTAKWNPKAFAPAIEEVKGAEGKASFASRVRPSIPVQMESSADQIRIKVLENHHPLWPGAVTVAGVALAGNGLSDAIRHNWHDDKDTPVDFKRLALDTAEIVLGTGAAAAAVLRKGKPVEIVLSR